MEDEKTLLTQDPQGLTPLDIIRTETVLSRLPVHNLSKKGSSISINIVKKNAKGELDLFWGCKPKPRKFHKARNFNNLVESSMG